MSHHPSKPVARPATADALLARLDAALGTSVALLEESAFVQHLLKGEHVLPLYTAYLQQAYHFVRLTSSFTPLSARRMDPELLALRQWILHHSAHEMGHELMALDDLALLGIPREQVQQSDPLPGTWAWVNFFHYEVTNRRPIAAMGVLYFLEGMAAKLAPIVGRQLATVLTGEQRKAVSFVQEHGELDAEHSEEGREMLALYCTDPLDADELERTILLGGSIKRFLLDDLVQKTLSAR